MANTMYEDYKVYGPYQRDDLRSHVILIKGEERITVSYPRYLMECHLNRKLNHDEEIHHLDDNPTNNVISNLTIVNSSVHRSLQTKYNAEFWKCTVCGKEWLATPLQVRNRTYNIKRSKSKTGPFCSKKCSGKVNN